MIKPILVDVLVRVLTNEILTPRASIGGEWFISRPLPFYRFDLHERIYHAWLVLCGRAHAYQYREDRPTP